MKKVAIIILNYNGKENSLECLRSLAKLSNRQTVKLSIIVIDNASIDGSVEVLKDRFPKVNILENKENLGFAEGNNVGIRHGLKNGFDYIMLLNNDTLVKKDFLIQLIKVAERNEKIGIVTPKIYFAPGFEFHKNRYKAKDLGRVIWFAGGEIDWRNVLTIHKGVDQVDKGQYDKVSKTELATGCCMLVKRKVFEKIGLFDKKYFLYWEDVDFCTRARQAGFEIIFNPEAIIWHKNAGSSASGSVTHDYYLTRNRLYFGLKYAGLRAKIALLKESLILLLKGRAGQKKGVFDFYRRRFGKIKDD